MKYFYKIISVVFTLCFIVASLGACNRHEPNGDFTSGNDPIEAGFTLLVPTRVIDEGTEPILFCAYRFDKRIYATDETMKLSVYYGARHEKRNDSIYRDYPINVGLSIDQTIVLTRTFNVSELFVPKYGVELGKQKYYSEQYDVIDVSYSFSQEIEIPVSLISKGKGTIEFIIEQHENDGTYNSYGHHTNAVEYKVEDGKIYLSDLYSYH